MEQAKRIKEEAGSLKVTRTSKSEPQLPAKAKQPPAVQQAVAPQILEPALEQPISERASLKRLWRTFSVLSIFLPVAFFIYCLWSYSRLSPGLDIRVFSELEKTALQINLDASNSLASLTVGLVGGVWALVLGLDKKPRITGGELVPLIGGSASLILSYISYRMGLVKYVEMLFDAQTVDISAGFVKHWPTWQFVFFIYGFIVLVIALLTVYRRS
jgi:hypothetical protein